MDLATTTHVLTARLPRDERFGLAAQMRRCAASIPANIAEGNARAHRGDYVHHLSIARGSLAELSTHFEVAQRMGYLASADCEAAAVRDLIDHVSRMLHRMIDRLRQ